jgi:hypothetical protein
LEVEGEENEESAEGMGEMGYVDILAKGEQMEKGT